MKAAFLFLLAHCFLFGEAIKISPQEVHVTDQGIFIYLNGDWVAVEISRENQEFSIKPLYQTISYGFTWKCNCGKWNFGSDQICQGCGRGRYDYSDE